MFHHTHSHRPLTSPLPSITALGATISAAATPTSAYATTLVLQNLHTWEHLFLFGQSQDQSKDQSDDEPQNPCLSISSATVPELHLDLQSEELSLIHI